MPFQPKKPGEHFRNKVTATLNDIDYLAFLEFCEGRDKTEVLREIIHERAEQWRAKSSG